MADFIGKDLHEPRFERLTLTRPTFELAELPGARFRACEITDAEIRSSGIRRVVMAGVELQDVEITGELLHVTINGVDVGPLVEAELDRREPDRVRMRPTDAEGFREAWALLERLWAGTVERAAGLDPVLLHESVDGEWSFIETLRHLSFVTDAWFRRAIQGDPSPWDPLDLPWDDAPADLEIPRDRTARPTFETALALRQSRFAAVRDYLAALTDELLASDTAAVPGNSWPPPRSFPVRECLLVLLNEEWLHRKFAERDLAVLESRAA